MSRYSRGQFNTAGIEPQECDGGAYPGRDGDAPYWFACTYHSGYLDGTMDAIERGLGWDGPQVPSRPLTAKVIDEAFAALRREYGYDDSESHILINRLIKEISLYYPQTMKEGSD